MNKPQHHRSLSGSDAAARLLGRIFERSAQEIFVIHSGTGNIALVNHAACMNLGYSRDGLMCKAICDICPDLSLAELKKITDRLDGNGAFINIDSSFRRRVGTTYPIRARFEYVGTRDQPLLAVFASDISEKAINAHKMEIAAHIGKHCFSSMNLDSWEIQRDPALDAIYGFDAFDPHRTAHDFVECILPDYRETVREQFVALSLGTIEQIDHTFPIRSRDGQDKWIRGIGRISDHDPRIVVGMQTEVTADIEIAERERQNEVTLTRVKDNLETSEKELRTLMAAMPDAVTRATPDTVLTYANGKYCGFLGLQVEDVLGRSFFDFIPSSDHELTRNGLAKLTPQNPMASFEQAMGKPDQDTWFLWSNLKLFDGDGNPVEIISVGRDISDLVRARRALDASNAKLEKRNTALQKFSATVAHDLKSPIRHITMFADTLGKEIAAGRLEKVPDYANQIKTVAHDMTTLIEGLLEYSRIAYEDIEMDAVDMGEVVEDAKRLLWAQIDESSARITTEPLPVLVGNYKLLVSLMQNLIGNSIKYHRLATSPEITISCTKTLVDINLSVTDNGIGIDPRNEDWIFGIFHRLHSDQTEYAGTGIGLALARQIAESHHGTLKLDPDYRNGSRFILKLPRQQPGL